jgi:dynein heavy chain 1
MIYWIQKCRETSRRVTIDAVDPKYLEDSSFLNKLQNGVIGWVKEIHKVTRLDRNPAGGSALQEVNFWISMERALGQLEERLKADDIGELIVISLFLV